jgi:hypothetical protein
MTKGVLSPWEATKKESPADTAERMIEESPEGAPRREITFDGRAFQITVAFFSFDKDMKRMSSYAHDALGRALASALAVDSVLAREMARQSIFMDETKVLAAKVTIRLGPVTLFVKASSFDPKMAQLMAMDRIALAMVDSRNASVKVKKAMDDHDVVIARKA